MSPVYKTTRLFCFSYAGGSAYSFQPLMKHLPVHIKLQPLELPGRGIRINEPLLSSMEDLISDLFKQIKPFLNEEFAFIGHSLGAIIAFLLSQQLENFGYRRPSHLFLSGNRGPNFNNQTKNIHKMPTEQLWASIFEIGGMTNEVFNSKDMRQFFEPVIRADFKAVESFVYLEQRPVSIPVTIINGINDRTLSNTPLGWEVFTSGACSWYEFTGGHFFIFDHARIISDLIIEKLLFTQDAKS